MKKIMLFGVLAIFTAMTTMSFNSDVELVGKDSSKITWVGKKVTGQHTGTVQFAKKSIKMDENGALVSGNFSVDMTTIKCTDLDAENAPKLEGHLSSEDFFDVKNHPTASFVTTSVESMGKGCTL